MSYVLATGLAPSTVRELTSLELQVVNELLTKKG